MIPDRAEILKIVSFRTSRSGGKGGQNVNKVSSKVELIFNINDANFLNEDEKALLKSRLEKRTAADGCIHIISQEDRSQLLNKEKTIVKLIGLIKKSLHVQKKRKPTKTPKSVIENRLKNKTVKSDLKRSRKKPSMD
ncbi:alternative ribosome rescue aminoacyl-tRNA hydrolase ArfB [Pedobacter rhodius]|uniref:Alternative ribosome rescue aminoacyl-tRNA hydrolase ArfB n=1 Tax=Pedobacter rhodius TaxID=3004098 RepID=A0ABT4KT46_9SPHI|nr:alternative ribosome rescue aminoacyl-tRNA hydrolase ArfB [Pedobacter sp. SJ11]MCZ4222075.1 alternative ribosome rescue aminoacyl-tRNA hydrolase ArfB [Pedobacter sp. SJ11]